MWCGMSGRCGALNEVDAEKVEVFLPVGFGLHFISYFTGYFMRCSKVECSNQQFGCWMAVGDTIRDGLGKILEQQHVAFCSGVEREEHANNSQLLRIMYFSSPRFSGFIAYYGSFWKQEGLYFSAAWVLNQMGCRLWWCHGQSRGCPSATPGEQTFSLAECTGPRWLDLRTREWA